MANIINVLHASYCFLRLPGIISFNPHINSVRWALLLLLFYGCGNEAYASSIICLWSQSCFLYVACFEHCARWEQWRLCTFTGWLVLDWLLGTQSSLSFSFSLCKMLGVVRSLPHRATVAAESYAIWRSSVNWKLCWMMDYKLEVLWWSRKATPFGKRDWFFFPLETETFLYVGWELALDVSLPPALGNARTSCPCMVGRQRSKGEILKWPFWSSEHKEPWATQ